uniref:Uncharacterized protein n=1 Tax=Rhizophora mucronata TaxID=61149 RepID=A0A2P2NVY7_RHIMU
MLYRTSYVDHGSWNPLNGSFSFSGKETIGISSLKKQELFQCEIYH